jgi:hypothetical protein
MSVFTVSSSFLNNLIICVSVFNILLLLLHTIYGVPINLGPLDYISRFILLFYIIKFRNDPIVSKHRKVFIILLLISCISVLFVILPFRIFGKILRYFRLIELFFNLILIYKCNIIRKELSDYKEEEKVMYNLFSVTAPLIVPINDNVGDNEIEIR